RRYLARNGVPNLGKMAGNRTLDKFETGECLKIVRNAAASLSLLLGGRGRDMGLRRLILAGGIANTTWGMGTMGEFQAKYRECKEATTINDEKCEAVKNAPAAVPNAPTTATVSGSASTLGNATQVTGAQAQNGARACIALGENCEKQCNAAKDSVS